MPFTFDPNGIEWVDETLGRRISLDGVGDLVDQLIDTTDEDEIDLILDMLSEQPTPEETRRWKLGFWLLLKGLFVSLAMIAAAGTLVGADFEAVQILLLIQLGYLDRFAQQVADGTVSAAEAGRRMKMYVNSARSAFWTVLDRKMEEAGYTEERWFAIGDRNTCSPCNEADGMGWQPIGTFGVPGSGYVLLDPTTECSGLTACRCRKTYRRGVQ